VARSADGHPVLLLSPSGFSPLLLSALAEELASHGYVVVGINPTYETTVTPFADGRVVPVNPAALGGALGPQSGSHEEAFRQREQVCNYKAADLASVADHLELLRDAAGPLAGALDLGRLGVVGHSFGGNAALEWCRVDPRCLAAVNLDGAVWTEVGRVGLDRPALQVLSEHGEFDMSPADAVAQGMAPDEAWYEAEKAITFGGWTIIDERARPGRTATIAGARHLSFMDVPFLPALENAAIAAMLAAVTIAPERMWRVTSDLVLAFFGEQLDGVESPLLDGDTGSHPEVRFGAP
jgi:pimeloyl-ACP methyl ester carboxylesterase